MTFRSLLIVVALAAMLCALVEFRAHIVPHRHGRIVRSAAARREFRKLHPCPGTGSTGGPCPGYVIDHVKPLACGGADSPANMQWQTIEDGKAKDAVERKDSGS